MASGELIAEFSVSCIQCPKAIHIHHQDYESITRADAVEYLKSLNWKKYRDGWRCSHCADKPKLTLSAEQQARLGR